MKFSTVFKRVLSTLVFLMICSPSVAAPFSACPNEAFLTQGKPGVLYGVNLTSGQYDLLSELNTVNKLNGMGFNYHDGYLYAWYYEGQTLARIHADYSIEPLTLQPALSLQYYVGDTSVAENAHFLYRKNGDDGGLWRIELDPSGQDYLAATRIATTSNLYLNIFDMAFHPSDGFIYSVDNIGRLYRISPANGSRTVLGNVGESGTFGAVYFDAGGQLYISRNQDGRIFRIDPNDASPTAQFFSYGPASSNNDGARCALAPVAEPATPSMDFGDAPISYGTRMAENGARHVVVSGIRLGGKIDAENRAFLAPDESDDAKDGSDDEDGVQVVTSITQGEQAILQVATTGNGFLNVWIDLDRNGTFDGADQLVTDLELSGSTHFVTMDVPAESAIGPSWMRVRYASTVGLSATGAASDGEVEDYPIEITRPSTKVEYYPSESGVVTVAFEDLWPSVGDYDLNDLVVYLRTSITSDTDAGQRIRQISVEGEFAAVGAAFHSGFAIAIPGLKTKDVDYAKTELLIDGKIPTAVSGGTIGEFQPLQGIAIAQNQNALFEITRDLWNVVEKGEGCAFFRSDNNCGAANRVPFSLVIPVVGNVPLSSIEKGAFDPFLFATTGYGRSSIFVDSQGNPLAPGDGLEIHLKNQLPTWRADQALLGRSSDRSQSATLNAAGSPVSYQTANGLPWAIEVPARWCYPSEYQDLSIAYPDFPLFVLSNGTQARNWYVVGNAASHPTRGAAGYLYKQDGLLDASCAQ